MCVEIDTYNDLASRSVHKLLTAERECVSVVHTFKTMVQLESACKSLVHMLMYKMADHFSTKEKNSLFLSLLGVSLRQFQLAFQNFIFFQLKDHAVYLLKCSFMTIP